MPHIRNKVSSKVLGPGKARPKMFEEESIVAKKKNPWDSEPPGFPKIMFEWTTCPTCLSITTLRQCWGCLQFFCYDCLQEHMIGCKAWQDLKKSKEV